MRPSDLLYAHVVGDTLVKLDVKRYSRKNKEPLVVAFAINASYVNQLGTTLLSLLRYNTGFIIAYIMVLDVSDNMKSAVSALTSQFPRLTVNFIKIDNAAISALHLTSALEYITKETYFRYFLPELLPQHNKILYLDADLIICDSLQELWDLPLKDNLCAGVIDTWTRDCGHWESLGLTRDAIYVNAGVLLFNLRQMRAENMTQRLLEVTAKQQWFYMDQDVINMTFQNRIIPLEARFNVTGHTLKLKLLPFRKRIAIMHYTGVAKPWFRDVKRKEGWRYRAAYRDWEVTCLKA